MSNSKVAANEIVAKSFDRLRAKDGNGCTWRDREALFSRLWSLAPMSSRAAEVILEVVADASKTLRPGQAITVSNFRYTLEQAEPGYNLVRIEDLRGSAVWSLARSNHRGNYHFTIRQRHEDDATVLVSGTLLEAKLDTAVKVISTNHSSKSFLALTRLATSVTEGMSYRERMMIASDPLAPVMALDGGVPGENARRLHRMLYEDTARRAMAWAVPLFAQVALTYAKEGFWWGCEAAQWSIGDDDRFPGFNCPTTTSCLLPHSDNNTVSMLFRDAQPNLETETYIVWRAAGLSPKVNLLPIDEGSLDDIEEYIRSGGVPALSFDTVTGDVHVSERAISSGVLRAFCDHVGEAWAVMATAPLYAPSDERPMATEDFTSFGTIAPWTSRGRRIAAAAVAARNDVEKKNPAF
jgi:hypothetical protein